MKNMHNRGVSAWIEKDAECSVQLNLAYAQCTAPNHTIHRNNGLLLFRSMISISSQAHEVSFNVNPSGCLYALSTEMQDMAYSMFHRCLLRVDHRSSKDTVAVADTVKVT